MILSFIEVTSKGDSFGFTVDGQGRRINQATRIFLVTVDEQADRNIPEILELLPQKGSLHPYLTNCYVTEVDCKVTEDVHVYQATVDYEGPESEESEDDPDVEWPWNDPADVSFSTDSSLMEVKDRAYAGFGQANMTSLTSDDFGDKTSGDGIHATVPIVNVPFKEFPQNLPEEPEPMLKISIAFAIKDHDISAIQNFLNASQTVNDNVYTIKGYQINRYCGYLSEFSAKAAYFKAPSGTLYPYWDISIGISVRPSKTWIRAMINMGFNRLVETGGIKTKEHITIKDSKSGKLEKISDPVRLHPEGYPIDILADGTLKDPPEDPSYTYVNLYLTKPLSNWDTFKNDIPED